MQLNAIIGLNWATLEGAWKTEVLRAMCPMKAQFRRFQRRRILETILVMCWQRMWLLSALCPKKSLSKTKLKRFGQMPLVEASKQPSTDCARWLSVITIIQIYNEKEPIMQKEIENKIYSWGGEYTGVYVTLEPSKPTEMRSLKKGLMLN